MFIVSNHHEPSALKTKLFLDQQYILMEAIDVKCGTNFDIGLKKVVSFFDVPQKTSA